MDLKVWAYGDNCNGWDWERFSTSNGFGDGAIAFVLNFLYSKLEEMEKTAYAGPTRSIIFAVKPHY